MIRVSNPISEVLKWSRVSEVKNYSGIPINPYLLTTSLNKSGIVSELQWFLRGQKVGWDKGTKEG